MVRLPSHDIGQRVLGDPGSRGAPAEQDQGDARTQFDGPGGQDGDLTVLIFYDHRGIRNGGIRKDFKTARRPQKEDPVPGADTGPVRQLLDPQEGQIAESVFLKGGRHEAVSGMLRGRFFVPFLFFICRVFLIVIVIRHFFTVGQDRQAGPQKGKEQQQRRHDRQERAV